MDRAPTRRKGTSQKKSPSFEISPEGEGHAHGGLAVIAIGDGQTHRAGAHLGRSQRSCPGAILDVYGESRMPRSHRPSESEKSPEYVEQLLKALEAVEWNDRQIGAVVNSIEYVLRLKEQDYLDVEADYPFAEGLGKNSRGQAVDARYFLAWKALGREPATFVVIAEAVKTQPSGQVIRDAFGTAQWEPLWMKELRYCGHHLQHLAYGELPAFIREILFPKANEATSESESNLQQLGDLLECLRAS